jgi:hypothetical protein
LEDVGWGGMTEVEEVEDMTEIEINKTIIILKIGHIRTGIEGMTGIEIVTGIQEYAELLYKLSTIMFPRRWIISRRRQMISLRQQRAINNTLYRDKKRRLVP